MGVAWVLHWLTTTFCCGADTMDAKSALSAACDTMVVGRLQLMPAPCMYWYSMGTICSRIFFFGGSGQIGVSPTHTRTVLASPGEETTVVEATGVIDVMGATRATLGPELTVCIDGTEDNTVKGKRLTVGDTVEVIAVVGWVTVGAQVLLGTMGTMGLTPVDFCVLAVKRLERQCVADTGSAAEIL